MLNKYYQDIKQISAYTIILCCTSLLPFLGHSQSRWMNQNEVFGLISPDIQVFKSSGSVDGSPFIAFYVSVNMNKVKRSISVDTTRGRRLTPSGFFLKNNAPRLVMNCSFFEFKQNRNVNIIVQNGKMVGFDTMPMSRKGKDTLTFAHHFGSAFGWTRSGKMDIVYTYNDSSMQFPLYSQHVIAPIIDSCQHLLPSASNKLVDLKKWKPQFAFGGGPSLLKNGQIYITNNEERKFAGKAIEDKHPRTAIGYTKDGRMILLVVQGRMKNLADGATLPQLAKILMDLECVEGMNLDGGGSSCLLINGKETIKPSDPEGQRPVPAVLIVK